VVLDVDGDGVPDDLDKCPGTGQIKRVDASGCVPAREPAPARVTLPAPVTMPPAMPIPPPTPAEAAPTTPVPVPMDKSATPASIAAQAPVTEDADADGILDNRDLCPDSPASAKVDSMGCAEDTAIKLDGINFANDSHELTQEARRILDRVAGVILQNPDLRLQVAGHTDNQGDANYNQLLSMQRAEAVMDYLVAQGVSRNHIGAVGYGGQRPIADNSTAEGQQQNRRVELRRLGF
jgi:OOP family OmpA-OmpF porin